MIDRRLFLSTLAASAAGGLILSRTTIAQDIADMKPGDYFWDPDRAPDGLVVVVVSIPEQKTYVYRDGVLIGVSTSSTGRQGYETPTGVFTILQKDKVHHSDKYNNASMPYTERLTWSGVALHAGNLPGYPTSHGCIHLPLAFSKDLFGITQLGTPVIVADSHSGPSDLLDPGLLLPEDGDSEALAKTIMTDGDKADPDAAPASAAAVPASVIASAADQKIYVMENGELTFEGPISFKDGPPIGSTVYLMKATSPGASATWTAIRYETADGSEEPDVPTADPLQRITADADVRQRLVTLFTPGATLLVTQYPADPATRSDPGFLVATHATS
ncbi:L,D-transpeptidase [Amorphus sp. 3PC139-8]